MATIENVTDEEVIHVEKVNGGNALLFLLFFLIIAAQVALYLWKKHRYSSFRNVTLLGLWVIPFGWSLYLGYWRMIFIWIIFSSITGYIIKIASKKPLEPHTPRKVYVWFYRLYQLCSNIAILGYVMFIVDYLSASRNGEHLFGQYGTLFSFYGLYFGVLGRDCSEMCADWMASMMGFTGKKDELPSRHISPDICGICGGRQSKLVTDITEKEISDETEDKTILLNCEHSFHSWCIRGWTIVGKKDVCPICAEKVDLSATFVNPWEKQSIWWGKLLDALHYLIVWNPIILVTINFILKLFLPHQE